MFLFSSPCSGQPCRGAATAGLDTPFPLFSAFLQAYHSVPSFSMFFSFLLPCSGQPCRGAATKRSPAAAGAHICPRERSRCGGGPQGTVSWLSRQTSASSNCAFPAPSVPRDGCLCLNLDQSLSTQLFHILFLSPLGPFPSPVTSCARSRCLPPSHNTRLCSNRPLPNEETCSCNVSDPKNKKKKPPTLFYCLEFRIEGFSPGVYPAGIRQTEQHSNRKSEYEVHHIAHAVRQKEQVCFPASTKQDSAHGVLLLLFRRYAVVLVVLCWWCCAGGTDLFAAQQVFHSLEHPSGLLKAVFKSLFDQQVRWHPTPPYPSACVQSTPATPCPCTLSHVCEYPCAYT